MTDNNQKGRPMADMPERIWAVVDNEDNSWRVCNYFMAVDNEKVGWTNHTEYIRADLAQASDMTLPPLPHGWWYISVSNAGGVIWEVEIEACDIVFRSHKAKGYALRAAALAAIAKIESED